MIWKLDTCGYEELFKVPAIVKIPKLKNRGFRSHVLAENIDLLPTILEAAGIPLPPRMDGQSLLPVIDGRRDLHREIVFFRSHGPVHYQPDCAVQVRAELEGSRFG